MSYRKLSITNANSATWTLADESFPVFGTNLDGFGLSNTNALLRIGDMNYVSYSMNDLNEISLEILFYNDTVEEIYRDYSDFVAFLAVGGLYLIYEVPGVNTYRRPIIVNSIGKGEIDYTISALRCPFAIHPLGFWEDRSATSVSITGNNSVSVVNNGNIDAPFEIAIVGTSTTALTNPAYTVSQSGSAYGIGKFTGSFMSVDVVTEELSESITLTQSATVTNPYNYQDLTVGSDGVAVTFFGLKPGTSSIAITGANSTTTTTITYRGRYASV